jgi:microcystin-dependent protein
MAYQVQFTDSTNPNKPPITVADGTVNISATSIGFVGQSYPGYAPIIADDLLHLLENFAAPVSPANPIQGQLWYDTNANILKVFDSTNWVTAGNLKKGTSAPAVANSIAGDLWTNTGTNQLYLFTGSNWILVGPQFSVGTQTGPSVDTIVDSNNFSHYVISLYTNNSIIAIISKEKFIPKSTIVGFSIINEGINLSSIDATNTTNPTRFWGTAQQADALLYNGTTVNAQNFLRSDIVSTTSNQFNIQSDAGIAIGSNLGFVIDIEAGVPTLKSTVGGTSFNLKLTNSGGVTNTLLHADASGNIGINNASPGSELDVTGLVTASTGVKITGTTDSSYSPGTAFTTATGSITTQGGISVAKKSIFGDDVTSYGQYFLNYLDNNSTPIASSVILPGYSTNTVEAANLNIPLVNSPLYDIGTSTRSFRNIYATNFSGNFTGTFTGTLEGSANGTAAALSSPTVFSLTGDVTSNNVSFNGRSETGTAIFNTSISQSFISTKQVATDSLATDSLLAYRSGVGLLQMPKAVLIKHIATMPVGSILPFAGSVVPAGYLLCDGSEILIATYSDLYSVIGYSYKAPGLLDGLGSFGLPDLRGRFPLGADNMNNNITVPSRDGSGNLVSTTLDLNGNFSTAAHRVNDTTANIVGQGNVTATGTIQLGASNLPDHTHSLNDGTSQFYAVNTPSESADKNAVSNKGTTGLPGTGAAILNTGSVNGTTSVAINIMNPYQTINYIIFTGVI